MTQLSEGLRPLAEELRSMIEGILTRRMEASKLKPALKAFDKLRSLQLDYPTIRFRTDLEVERLEADEQGDLIYVRSVTSSSLLTYPYVCRIWMLDADGELTLSEFQLEESPRRGPLSQITAHPGSRGRINFDQKTPSVSETQSLVAQIGDLVAKHGYDVF